MARIFIAHATKEYHVRRKVVRALTDVSFSVPMPSFLALTGVSGSGKTTMLHLIGGLEMASAGEISVAEQHLEKMSRKELAAYRRENVGIVFQQFYLEPTLTVRQNFELPAMFAGLSKERRAQRTAELAEFIGLEEHLNHRPNELSGGQIQRAAIARAIYNHPKILIADEPTSNLDPENTMAVVSLFRKICDTYGTTIIVATHDDRVSAMADYEVKLAEGQVVGMEMRREVNEAA